MRGSDLIPGGSAFNLKKLLNKISFLFSSCACHLPLLCPVVLFFSHTNPSFRRLLSRLLSAGRSSPSAVPFSRSFVSPVSRIYCTNPRRPFISVLSISCTNRSFSWAGLSIFCRSFASLLSISCAGFSSFHLRSSPPARVCGMLLRCFSSPFG